MDINLEKKKEVLDAKSNNKKRKQSDKPIDKEKNQQNNNDNLKKNKKAHGNGESKQVNSSKAIMPLQNLQQQNGCWVPPVISVANFYDFSVMKDQTTKVSMESINALCPGDEPEEFCEMFEEAFGVWPAKKTFSNDPDLMEDLMDVKCCGPTSIKEHGIWKVSKTWFDEVKKTIQENDLVILLVERLERKDKGNTHYLVVFGYEETRRRNRESYSLIIKDPNEGDTLLEAKLWDDNSVELTTKQTNGSTLDRFNILEATHLSVASSNENKDNDDDDDDD